MGDVPVTDVSVRLRASRPEDRAAVALWANDDRTTWRFMATGRMPVSEEEAGRIWLPPAPDAAAFIIEGFPPKPSEQAWAVVGVCGLYGIDWISRKAELRIIVEKLWHGERGRGVGTQACKMLLRTAFQGLGLERVWLGTASENIVARRCFEKVGFVEEGILRRDLYRDGAWHDNVRYGVLREEWDVGQQG